MPDEFYLSANGFTRFFFLSQLHIASGIRAMFVHIGSLSFKH